MTKNQRKSQRYERRLPVELKVDGEWRQGMTRNLSVAGAFVEIEDKPPFGARVNVKLPVPGERSPIVIEVGACVRWLAASGVGLQFDGLRAREVWALGKYFDRSGG